ncbi:MAG: DNA-protecting protein DprA, partial [Proteobacteria bacterium]|nr:DNA-protecting protein DprA [Pseudomonadota bacterium]
MTARVPSAGESLAWLRLARTERVGPVTFHHLVGRYGSASAALDALPELARRGGRSSPLRVTTRADAERELEAHTRLGARLI